MTSQQPDLSLIVRQRVVGDVHGEVEALRDAVRGLEPDRQLILLGDLVDFEPDSLGCLLLALDLVENDRAVLLRSNHDDKLYRALLGRPVQASTELQQTLEQLSEHPRADAVKERIMRTYEAAPFCLRWRDFLVVHGAFHPDMLTLTTPEGAVPPKHRSKLEYLALYAEGRPSEGGGLPVRTYNWIDHIPAGVTAVVGHDVRSTEAPLAVRNRSGGRGIFLDTGAGKGGHLSWIDLPEEEIGPSTVRVFAKRLSITIGGRSALAEITRGAGQREACLSPEAGDLATDHAIYLFYTVDPEESEDAKALSEYLADPESLKLGMLAAERDGMKASAERWLPEDQVAAIAGRLKEKDKLWKKDSLHLKDDLHPRLRRAL